MKRSILIFLITVYITVSTATSAVCIAKLPVYGSSNHKTSTSETMLINTQISVSADIYSVLQEERLKDISSRLMEVYFGHFASGDIPRLPRDITNMEIGYYFYLICEEAHYGSEIAKQTVSFNKSKNEEITISKASVDEIAALFGKKITNLNNYLPDSFQSKYDVVSENHIIKHEGFAGYHNNETFFYNFNDFKFVGDAAVVSYYTYFTEDFNKFMNETNTDWSFRIKVGTYNFYYIEKKGFAVLLKTEYIAKPEVHFYTQ